MTPIQKIKQKICRISQSQRMGPFWPLHAIVVRTSRPPAIVAFFKFQVNAVCGAGVIRKGYKWLPFSSTRSAGLASSVLMRTRMGVAQSSGPSSVAIIKIAV